MKVRNFVSALTIIALTSSQIAFATGVVAGNSPISGPVTNPISSPITINPITSPITAPIIIIKPPVIPPIINPIITPKPKPIYSYEAPTMVYPQNNQTLDLEGAYSFKVKPVLGSTGYLFGFFQDGKAVFENYANLRTLSPNGEFTISESMPVHSKFHAGKVTVWIRALVNNQWTDARIITVNLKPRSVSTPVSSTQSTQTVSKSVSTPAPLPTPLSPAVVKILKPVATQSAIQPTTSTATPTPTITPKPVVIQAPVLRGNVNYDRFVAPIQNVVNKIMLPLKGISQTLRFW